MEKSGHGHYTPPMPRFAENDVVHDASDDARLKNIPTASPEAIKFVDAIGVCVCVLRNECVSVQ
jgi:hypothetical protein